MSRNLRALVGALALSIAIVPSVFAGSISETLAVNSILTVTGVPASIDYGNVDPGATSAAQAFTANVVTNGGGWTLKMSGSDFTGPGTITKINREGQIDQPSFGTSAATSFTNFANSAFDGTTVTASGPTGSSSFGMQFRVHIPAAQAPGAYTGTITYTFTGS